jgi:DNA helicase HerA-like ATPase
MVAWKCKDKTMQAMSSQHAANRSPDPSIGRIVSVTGSKAIVLLDTTSESRIRSHSDRPEMGTLLAIDTASTTVLAIVSALSVPVPSQREGDNEVWIAELGLVGELLKSATTERQSFNRGVTVYPALGDRVRVAKKPELEVAFCGSAGAMVRIGSIRQDSTIPAMVRVDDLLGKHFAVLGTTGTGKSCTTALILRSILEQNPAAHIVLLDPHNEYATAFTEWAEVISPRDMQLPFWLLTFEELLEVLVGDSDRKTEIEALQDLIPVAKSRYSSSRSTDTNKIRRGNLDYSRFTVDTPVPYRISDLVALIDERMGRLENKKDLAPYRSLKHRIETVSQDRRYAFMFGSLTVYDGMAQVLSRIFRVPVNNKPITILELTGIPSEIVNVVVSVLCRMTFDFALWSEGQVPVTLVCEEAHRYVPANTALGFEPCKRAIAKIAKEGRKYGASLCIVTQRPAEIDPTILSQCNTVFALRMSNDRDQAIVASAVADTGAGLLEFLPSLGEREAIAFGDGMALPVRIKFDELPRHALPRSSTARFSEKWQRSLGDEGFLDQVVVRWRASAIPAATEGTHNNLSMMAEALGIREPAAVEEAVRETLAARAIPEPTAETRVPPPTERSPAPAFRRDGNAATSGYQTTRQAGHGALMGQRLPQTPEPMRSASPASAPMPPAETSTLRSLRARLTRQP